MMTSSQNHQHIVYAQLLPDLVINRIQVFNDDTGEEYSSGDTIVNGTDIEVQVFIRNIGNADVETDFMLEYFDNGTFVADDEEGLNIDAGGVDEEEEKHDFELYGFGTHTLQINLDTTGVVNESNENNNSSTFVLNVAGSTATPTLTPTDIPMTPISTPDGTITPAATITPNSNADNQVSIDSATIQAGQSITLSLQANVTNLGAADVDVVFDSSVLNATCEPNRNDFDANLCNETDGKIQLNIVSVSGITGEITLADITFG